jgi:hypothetical protein
VAAEEAAAEAVVVVQHSACGAHLGEGIDAMGGQQRVQCCSFPAKGRPAQAGSGSRLGFCSSV